MQLVVMRHAKSAWDSPTLDDYDRSLNVRGEAAAAAIGGWLRARGYLPDEVLCSAAARTRQTWAIASAAMGLDPATAQYLPELYLASEDRLLTALRRAHRDCVLIVAHNPGIGALAHLLARSAPEHAQFHRYPTAATAVFEIDAPSWADLRPAQNRLIDFVVPRDL